MIIPNKLEHNGITINIREDGYINATEICKTEEKKFNNWCRLRSTKKIIKELNNNNIKYLEKNSKNKDSWIHPDLAVQLATWVSASLSVKISIYLRNFEVYKQLLKYEEELTNLKIELKKEQEKKRKLLYNWRDIETKRLGLID